MRSLIFIALIAVAYSQITRPIDMGCNWVFETAANTTKATGSCNGLLKSATYKYMCVGTALHRMGYTNAGANAATGPLCTTTTAQTDVIVNRTNKGSMSPTITAWKCVADTANCYYSAWYKDTTCPLGIQQISSLVMGQCMVTGSMWKKSVCKAGCTTFGFGSGYFYYSDAMCTTAKKVAAPTSAPFTIPPVTIPPAAPVPVCTVGQACMTMATSNNWDGCVNPAAASSSHLSTFAALIVVSIAFFSH